MKYVKSSAKIIMLENGDLVTSIDSNVMAGYGRELAQSVYGYRSDSELNDLLEDAGVHQGILGLAKLMDEYGDWKGLDAWKAEAAGNPNELARMIQYTKGQCDDIAAAYSNDVEDGSDFDDEW